MTAGPTVAELLATLDAAVLGVRVAGGDTANVVTDIALPDATDEPAAGALVLGAGARLRSGLAGIVVREPGRDLPSSDSGPALLVVPPELPWGHLYSLLRTGLAGAHPQADGHAAGVAVGDLFSLANAIAAAVGLPVTIEDAQLRVLAYSSLDQPVDEPRRQTIVGRAPPPAWIERIEADGIIARLRGDEELLRFEHADLDTRLVAPVRAGPELLGSIWAAARGAVEPTVEAELVRAARIAAVHLVAHRAAEDVRRRTRGSFVREVLAGRGPRGGGAMTLMGFRLDPRAPAWDGDAERLLSVVTLYAEGVDPGAMTAVLDDRIWVVLPLLRDHQRERLLDAAGQTIARSARALGVELLGAVGAEAADAGAVPAARQATELALDVLAHGEDHVAHVADVRAKTTLLRLLRLAADDPALPRGPAGRLAEHDKRRGAELVSAMRAYLDAHGDTARAAASLGLHANTFRYRLRRAIEIAEVDLGVPEERLALELELRLLEQ